MASLPDWLGKFVRTQDLVWLILFAGLAFFGPERNPGTITFLVALAALQVIEPRLNLTSLKGTIVAFVLKLALCCLLIGWTEGIASSYYWVLFLPVLSAATALPLLGTTITTAIACGAYLSFWFRIGPDQYIPPDQVSELVLRVVIICSSAFLAHQLAMAAQTEARQHQAAAQRLAEANQQLLAAEEEARRADRLAALGQLSAGLAHELRNPLGIIKASAEMLGKNIAPENDVAREMASFISAEVDRTNSLVTRFLDFARPLAVRLDKTDVTQVIDRAIAQVEQHQPPLDVSIYKNYSPDVVPFFLDGELMERVIYNLAVNAAQASPPKSTVTVKTRRIDGMVEIAIIDRGSGIDPKHKENIFNPFFTTKSSGVGLGLAIVSKIVDEHGGSISVDSDPGNGSVFRVYLPMRTSAA